MTYVPRDDQILGRRCLLVGMGERHRVPCDPRRTEKHLPLQWAWDLGMERLMQEACSPVWCEEIHEGHILYPLQGPTDLVVEGSLCGQDLRPLTE